MPDEKTIEEEEDEQIMLPTIEVNKVTPTLGTATYRGGLRNDMRSSLPLTTSPADQSQDNIKRAASSNAKMNRISSQFKASPTTLSPQNKNQGCFDDTETEDGDKEENKEEEDIIINFNLFEFK
jgi:hypothetical protein